MFDRVFWIAFLKYFGVGLSIIAGIAITLLIIAGILYIASLFPTMLGGGIFLVLVGISYVSFVFAYDERSD